VTKAVIPVAGLGTRFLPATKAVPKALMPVVDKPAVQYVIEEAAAAGLQDVVLITDERQEPIAEHFSRNYDLAQAPPPKGNGEGLAQRRGPGGPPQGQFRPPVRAARAGSRRSLRRRECRRRTVRRHARG